jgi:hypothetical protein
MGGVWPRRPGPSGVLFAPPDPAAGGTFLLLLFSGILSGGTSRVSCTGSTMAVRPLAPRQPGRDEVNAPAAGSVLLSLAAAAFFAILLMRSPKDGGTAAGILCGPVCPCGAIPSPCANSAGLTCDGRPRVLLVCSPVSGSHRGASRGCGFRGCCGAGPRWVGFASRRIVSAALGASWGYSLSHGSATGSGPLGAALEHTGGPTCRFSACRCLGFRHGGMPALPPRLSAKRHPAGSDRHARCRARGSWAARFLRPRRTDSCIWSPRLRCSAGPVAASLRSKQRMQGENS